VRTGAQLSGVVASAAISNTVVALAVRGLAGVVWCMEMWRERAIYYSCARDRRTHCVLTLLVGVNGGGAVNCLSSMGVWDYEWTNY